MEQIRAFIAIELPDEIREKMGRLENQLKSAAPRSVRWVKPESIHLTLKFLGNIPGGRVSDITGAMQAAAEGISPFSIEVRGTGVFPNMRRPRVAWVGLRGETEKLSRLQKNIEERLKPLGFTAEDRGFTPHLTLARVDEQASSEERQAFGELIAGTLFEGGNIRVESVSLIRSLLTRGGAVYSQLAEVKLG